ncbi:MULTISPECIES: hypothetical protein [Mycobacterium]|uniref:PASTA domain-containing protein n=1 Tax=Mycobacterium syngnathidarum TaxID=1908205 RepID=A0A1Q9WC42_9MYCO|nr:MULTISPECIES: hypothetical protein [Mycobacterium]MCG7609924.1 hypothetical protein [Mycobacterium sp. CnD-18-1]OHT93474.1 hypothetical protein BKG61_21180 [Mycobacterium syngnathidarum]OLT96259.1 hypothetical protein BKG60_12705 [Mycobacterium syngnathidarum]
MMRLRFAGALAGAAVATVIGLAAPAQAAPTGPGNAQQTISNLQAQGYKVVVNHIGSTPLDKASVVAVRPGQTYSRTDSGNPGDNRQTNVVNRTVYVDVK